MRAYVLVKAIPGREREAIQAFEGLPDLQEIDFTLGKYDYVLTVETEDPASLARLVRNRIRRAPGIARTATFIRPNLWTAPTSSATSLRRP